MPGAAAPALSGIPVSEEIARETKAAVGHRLESPHVARERKMAELAARRTPDCPEDLRLSPFDFDPSFIEQLVRNRGILKRGDVQHPSGPQAVTLSRSDLEDLDDLMDPADPADIGGFRILHASGKVMCIMAESLREGDVLIIYPEELGE